MVQTLEQHVDLNGHSNLPAGLNSEDAERVQEALESARAPATRRVYASQWRKFAAWAERREVQTLPALTLRHRCLPERASRLWRIHCDAQAVPRLDSSRARRRQPR